MSKASLRGSVALCSHYICMVHQHTCQKNTPTHKKQNLKNNFHVHIFKMKLRPLKYWLKPRENQSIKQWMAVSLQPVQKFTGGVPVPPRGRLQRNGFDCSLSTQIWSHISWILFSIRKEHTNLTTLLKIKSFMIFVSQYT